MREFNVDEGKDAYGLMKVVEVHPDRLVVITDNAAWDNPKGARNGLRGDLKDIPGTRRRRSPSIVPNWTS